MQIHTWISSKRWKAEMKNLSYLFPDLRPSRKLNFKPCQNHKVEGQYTALYFWWRWLKLRVIASSFSPCYQNHNILLLLPMYMLWHNAQTTITSHYIKCCVLFAITVLRLPWLNAFCFIHQQINIFWQITSPLYSTPPYPPPLISLIIFVIFFSITLSRLYKRQEKWSHFVK